MSTQVAGGIELMEQDDSHLTHMVNCPPDKDSTDMWLFEARMYGLTVTAICGYQWKPERDPLKHPICQACVDAANIIIAEVNAA